MGTIYQQQFFVKWDAYEQGAQNAFVLWAQLLTTQSNSGQAWR